jgi:small conductance mechanosensitive channel
MHPLLSTAMWALRTGIFAEGRFLGRMLDAWASDGEEFIRAKLPHLLMVALIAFILIRLLHLIANRMISLAEQHTPEHNRVAQVKTLAGVIRATGLAVIGAIAGLQFLAAVGVNLAPLLTSAGIAGVAIGLAAQNIVRDMFNGVLILVEDQFNVGDTVRVAGVTGTVEAMTLRKSTVRDAEGTLYIIPNSQIATVANLSSGYSVATVPVSVDFSANPDEVRQLLAAIAMEVRSSDEFCQDFAADPQILGVDAIKGSEMIFPVLFKTLANRQYAPVREFKRRVRLALEEQHLLPGDPLRVFSGFGEHSSVGTSRTAILEAPAHDPTVFRPPSGHPFAGE